MWLAGARSVTAAVNKAEQRLVESHLRNLRSVDRLRRLLADLNYQVGDEPISIADWKSEIAKAAKDGGLRAVARHQDLVVTYCHLQELRVGLKYNTLVMVVVI